MSGHWLVSFGVIDVKVLLKPTLHAFRQQAGNWALRGGTLHSSIQIAWVKTPGSVGICSLKVVRTDHFALELLSQMQTEVFRCTQTDLVTCSLLSVV